MRIIILGMDNTGKTTLSNLLKNQLNYELINSLGKNINKENMIDFIKNNLKKDNVIFERFCFFEEIIYGNILRNYSNFDFEDEIYSYIKECKPIIIYCRPEINIIFDWKEREQMEGVKEKSKELLKLYDDVFNNKIKKDFKTLIWNYKKDDIKDLIYKIKSI